MVKYVKGFKGKNKEGLSYTITKTKNGYATLVFSKTGYETVAHASRLTKGGIKDHYSGKLSGKGVKNARYIELKKEFRDKVISEENKTMYRTWLNLLHTARDNDYNVSVSWCDIQDFEEFYFKTKPTSGEITNLNVTGMMKLLGTNTVGAESAIWITHSVKGLIAKSYLRNNSLEDSVIYREVHDTYTVKTISGRKVEAYGLNRREAENLVLSLRKNEFLDNISILKNPQRKMLTELMEDYMFVNAFN